MLSTASSSFLDDWLTHRLTLSGFPAMFLPGYTTSTTMQSLFFEQWMTELSMSNIHRVERLHNIMGKMAKSCLQYKTDITSPGNSLCRTQPQWLICGFQNGTLSTPSLTRQWATLFNPWQLWELFNLIHITKYTLDSSEKETPCTFHISTYLSLPGC